MAKDYVVITAGIRAVRNSIRNVSIDNYSKNGELNVPTMVIDYFGKESEEIQYEPNEIGYKKLHSDLTAILTAMEGDYEVSRDMCVGGACNDLDQYDLAGGLRECSKVFLENLELPDLPPLPKS